MAGTTTYKPYDPTRGVMGPVTPGGKYGVSTLSGPPEIQRQAEEAGLSTETVTKLESAKRRLGIPTTNDPMNYDEVLDFLDRQGIDTANPDVQLLAHQIAKMPNSDYQGQIRYIQTTIMPVQDLHKVGPTYQQVVGTLGGIDDLLFPKVAPTTAGQAQLYAHEPGAAPTEDYVDLKDKGVLVWKNGVIVNYGNTQIPGGQGPVVFYNDADPKQEGSYAWQRAIQQNWSPEQVAQWRQRLFKAGYLPTRKGKGWDSELISATKSYYDTKYTYGAATADAGSPGAAATGRSGAPSPKDIAALIEKNKATIRSSVISQYLSVFNQPPNEDELHSWTSFVVKNATELATGKVSQRLTPSQAINQAQADAAGRIFSSPQGQLVYESDKENTSLHDSLTTAISATRGLA
jgi:hypothetical protein